MGNLIKAGLGIVIMVLLGGSPRSDGAPAPEYYGTKPRLKTAISLDKAVDGFSQHTGKTILVQGQVTRLCQNKGCWMMLRGRQHEVRVTFKGYSFFVPKSLQNTNVLVQGELVRKTVSVATQKHFLEDAGASATEIAKITKPKQTFHFIATGVSRT